MRKVITACRGKVKQFYLSVVLCLLVPSGKAYFNFIRQVKLFAKRKSFRSKESTG